MSRAVVVLDYEMSNLRSAVKALEHLGATVRVARSADEIGEPAALVLPGVGHFGEAMGRIRAAGLDRAIVAGAERGTPVLGICLGMQLLFEASEESPGAVGLGLLEGRVVRLATERKLPHIGWNTVDWHGGGPLAAAGDQARERTYYFVHAFAPEPTRAADRLGECQYGVRFCAAAGREHVMGVQFHPEKSSEAGLALLRRWLAAQVAVPVG